MSDNEKSIPEETIEAIARGFFKETSSYGFRQVDYLKFVNQILDMSMKNGQKKSPEKQENALGSNPAPAGFPLDGERIIIREFSDKGDRELFAKWICDENGRYFLLSRTTAQTVDVEQLIHSDQNILGLVALTDGTPIGMMAYLDFDRQQKKAELRKLIGEPLFRGKGFAKEATILWIRYGLGNLGLKKIYLNTLDTNFRNIRLNEELGFKVEGILRNECFFDAQYHDILRMALIKD